MSEEILSFQKDLQSVFSDSAILVGSVHCFSLAPSEMRALGALLERPGLVTNTRRLQPLQYLYAVKANLTFPLIFS